MSNSSKKLLFIFRYTLMLIFALVVFCADTYNTNNVVVAAAVGDVKNYGYTGGIQSFTAPADGYYQLETWGAQGASGGSQIGGYGAYSKGVVFLTKGQVLYVVVGGTPGSARNSSVSGGYNGGGAAWTSSTADTAGGGGGATHIATRTGLLSTLSSYKSQVLIVSGGGGGGYYYRDFYSTGGHAGGISGGIAPAGRCYGRSLTYGRAATQSLGGGNNACGNNSNYYGSFGKGGVFASWYSGGGAGWYGGGGGYAHGANGGSSYIGNSSLLSRNGVTKSMYCYSCTTSTVASTYTVSTTNVSSTATSNYAKSGSGYARITLKEMTRTDARLESLTTSAGEFNQDFDKDIYNYDVVVDPETYNIVVDAKPLDSQTVVSGLGNYEIKVGSNKISIVATAQSGDTKVYTLNVTRIASSYQYLEDIKINGTSIAGFSPTQLVYDIKLPYNTSELDLDIVKGRPGQELYMPSDLVVKSGKNKYEITVISEDGIYSTTYVLNIEKEHSSKLKSLTIDGYTISPTFDPETLTYTVDLLASTMALTVNADVYDEEATIKLSGFGYIKSSKNATITVTEPNSETTVYTVVIKKGDSVAETKYEFPYTGKIQTFEAPAYGYYQLETWGAQGGSGAGNRGGYGAYATGVVLLNKGDILYIGVGGTPASARRSTVAGGYNGGGAASTSSVNDTAGGGGGATHIATRNGLLSSLSSYKSNVLIVSGGGGGGYYYPKFNSIGGNAGGISGGVAPAGTCAGRTLIYGRAATQTYAGGNNGCGISTGYYGGFGTGGVISVWYAGGGAGWYGGGAGFAHGGNGGSSYIGNSNLLSYKETTKSMYCYGCTTSTDESTYTVSTTNVSSTATSYYAKSGSGYARITMLAQPSENNFLSSITVNTTDYVTGVVETKSYTPEFDLEVEDYYVTVGENETKATLQAKPEDSTATITGLGEVPVLAGENTFEITVTAEAGNVKVYRVHITRPASTNQYPNDIMISGLVPSLCSVNDTFCVLDPATFDKDTNDYYITVPSRIKQLWFTVVKGHEYQVVTGDGKVALDGGENTITIEITSEDGLNKSVYNYYVTRDMTGNTDLSKLEVIDPQRDINYDPDITEYYLSVPNEYTSIKELLIETDDPNASYVVVGNEDFETGMNQVSIIVTAANGEVKTYILNVYREKSGNTYISDLTVTNGSTVYELVPEFNKVNLGTYKATVPNDITSVNINATAEVTTTNITGTGTKTLNTGDNEFTLIATAEDGSVETYTLIVYREKNSNTNLIKLEVANDSKIYTLDPTYSNDILQYNVEVEEGVSEVSITAVPEVTTTTYKLLDNNTIKVGTNVKRVMVIAEDGTSKTITINITRPANNNDYLASLIVKNGETIFDLTPRFDKEVGNYTLEVENEITSVEVLAEKESELAKLSGLGTYALGVGENEIMVSITSEAGSSRSYIIKITRKPNSNAYLKSLSSNVGEMSPEFNKETLEYTINVDSTTDEIKLDAVAEVNTTVVTGNGLISNLVSGSNKVNITTLAEDGTTSLTYVVNIVKALSSNNNIESLIMEEGALTPTFSPSITEYTTKVARSVESGTFHVVLEDDKASYEILGNENFEIGENTVIIRVTAEDGSKKDYTVVVTRQELTSNFLLDLWVEDYEITPEFVKETQYYTLNVPHKQTSVIVNATLEDVDATITGLGEHELEVGRNLIVVEIETLDNQVRYYQIEVTRARSDEARLSNLVINNTILTPNFDKDTYEYSLSTSDSELTFFRVETVQEDASFEIIGNSDFVLGTNVVTIRVTAADGVTTKDYVLNVEKTASNNNNLASLEVVGYQIVPNFNKTTTLYTLTVGNDVNSVTIEATAEDEQATISGDGVQYLAVGDNYFVVEVTSESGVVKAYTIIITKEGSNNNNIKDLIVNNGTMTPDFETGTTTYDVVVPYEEEELDLTVILEDDAASYNVIGDYLEVGSNTIQVVVTAENGDVKIYTLNVTREEIVSALLADLKVANYQITPYFNSYITDYNVIIDNEVTSLDLTIVPLDTGATYTVVGNENFIVGNNIIKIEVTASDGVTKEVYTLNVNRQAYANTYLDYLYTSKGDVKPTFDKMTLSYTIGVSNDVEEIEIFAEAVDKSAVVDGVGVHSLITGENVIPITVTSTSGIIRTYFVTVIRDKEDNNYLSSLSAKVGTVVYELTPEFDKNTVDYEVTVPVGTPSINISGTLESDKATATGFGVYTLNALENKIEISVTSEAGNVRTYTVVVNREASDNNRLIDLIPSIGQLEPEFNYEETEYTLNLDSSASMLSFTYTTEYAFATVTGADSQIVPDGTSTREIIVTAEDGSTRTYKITVNKERTDNARLANLYVEGYPFDETFDPDVFEYHITVPNSKKILLASEVVAKAEDVNATISKSPNLNLVAGSNNEFIVSVLAPDKFTTLTYKIIINREPSSEAILNSLIVNVGYLTKTFNPNVYEYTWMVGRGTILTEESVTAIASGNGVVTKTKRLEVKTGEEVYEVTVTSEDGKTSVTYKLNIDLDLSSDATLKELTIDKGYYIPTFNPNTYIYHAYEYVDTEEITVTAVPNSDTSEVTVGNGVVTLDSDEVVHNIVVTAEDGTVQNYVLNIHKTILNDKGLKNLGLNNLNEEQCGLGKCILSPAFDTDTLNYSITVPYEYTDLSILAETMNEQQSVKFKIGSEYIDTYSLPIGKTEVIVEVYDGMNVKTREYTLTVNRSMSNNTNLASLEVVDYTIDPVFDKGVLEYTVYVDYDVEEVEIKATAEDPNATVNINGYNYLAVGNNDATVTVTAPDGSSKTYIVHIIRSPLYNSYLKQITVSTGVFWDLSPNFKQTVFEYTATVSGMYDRVTIEAVPVSATTTVTGVGEFDIVTGSNIFTLVATAEDGSVSIYKINVIKENSRNVNLTNLIVEEGNLNPSFEKSITKYQVNVGEDVEKLTIHAVLEDPKSTYIITGNENLVAGENIVNVIVMSEDKSVSKTYQLVVNKAHSSNNYLSNLRVFDEDNEYTLSPQFNKDEVSYFVDLKHDVEKVTIEATADNAQAIVTGVGEEYLAYGDNIKQVIVTSENGEKRIYTINLYRNYNLDLKSLTSDIGELTPAFDKDILEYRITLPTNEDEITFTAEAESDKVSAIGSGTYSIDFEENEILFVVRAPDSKTKTYRVVVEREVSDNNYIESLLIHEGVLSPTFDRDVQNYEVKVINTVTKVGMDIVLEDENATYEVIGNSNLQVGSNEVIIRVTAQNKETRDYKINVILQGDNYFSNRLLDISITDGKLTPDFDPDVNYYTATVANSIHSTEITVVKENVDATVSGVGVVQLELGRNVFQVQVTSKDGIVNTYTLVIYREENSDATLSSLTVKNHTYQPIFNRNEENYTLEIEGEDSLEIEAIPTDKNSKVEISGNENLKVGVNIIEIKVTAPDNVTTKTYTLTVTKKVSTNNYLSNLEVIGYDLSPSYTKANQGPYTVNVESNVNSVVVDAKAESSTTTITGLGSHALTTGQNVITVQATSESGDVRIYTIIVNKAANTNTYLKEIKLSDSTLEPEFNKETLEYEVKVDTALEQITITGIAEEVTSVVSGNGVYKLEEDETLVTLTVKAEDGSTRVYKVNVVKDIESSSKIIKLVVKEGELYPSFHKNTTVYTILVPNEVTSLQDMEITLEDENATYEVIGNENFKVGNNTVIIRVTSADNTTTTDYSINVVRQIAASNYLKELVVTGYTLNPVFDKNTLYYEVNVPEDETEVEILATLEDATATLSGTGVKVLTDDENRFYVKVTSASGSVRTYSVVVNKTLKDDNLLLTLNPSVGTLEPDFDPYVNEYTLKVPEKTSSLKLDGTVSDNATVIGLTDYEISVGEKEILITVTSQSGVINTYKVKVIRPASTNTNLISLTPSSGEIEYSNDILEYDMVVEDNVSVISFEAVPEDEDATITGNDLTMLEYGQNEIIITVTAEDGVTVRNIKINVTREKDLIAIIPSVDELVLGLDEVYDVDYTLDPVDTSYTEVEWISLDENVVTVDSEGNVTGVGLGSTTVQIKSVKRSHVIATITVNVISKEITSSVYEINREDEEVKYVIGSDPKTTITDYIPNFDNNPSTLFIFDENDNEITDTETFVGSYMKIKLIINEVVYDELVIAVRGDLNGDGLVTAPDVVLVKNLILEKDEETYIKLKITDTNLDDLITAPDLVIVKNYILGKGELN